MDAPSSCQSNVASVNGKAENKKREFNFDRYGKRHVALMVLYLGWDYDGLVIQEDLSNTIEEHLYQALEKTKLIRDRTSCQLSRCGRTDKGVSAFRQVHSLEVRSNSINPPDSSDSTPQKTEMDYPKVLNGVLPADIRILAWAPVPEEFSARHSCQKRTYKYFIPRGNLNIDRIREAACYLEGTHDFRNFCRLDRNKNCVQTTERRILEARIEACSWDKESEKELEFGMYELTIVGTAFLWHQIRCIVGVLLAVGEGNEHPDIVKELLDVVKNPSKPQYPMATDFPLCLFDSQYEDLDWIWSQVNFESCLKVLQRKFAQAQIKATMLRRMLTEFGASIPGEIKGHGGVIDVLYPGPQPKKYKPLMERPTGEMRPKAKALGGKGGKKKNAVYGKGPELPAGEVITDQRKRRWKLGKAFASGGFGQIYTATSVDGIGEKVVIKMEPAANGPLFQEMHVYQRILKPEAIAAWKKKKGVKFLGIPQYLGSGKHEKAGVSHRFLIMPAFGKDLEHYREAEPRMSPSCISSLALNIIHALEYLHDERYVHADVKAENLLLEHAKSKDISRMFLVDFGLAKKVPEQPVYREDPRKAHDGTLIFTSLDAHRGCLPSFRGDMEILGYNILYWLTGDLPWIKSQNDPAKVFSEKVAFSESVDKSVRKCLASTGSSDFAVPLTKLFEYVFKLDYAARPDYVSLRKWMLDAGKKFSKAAPTATTSSSTTSRRSSRSSASSPEKPVRKLYDKSTDSEASSLVLSAGKRGRKAGKRISSPAASTEGDSGEEDDSGSSGRKPNYKAKKQPTPAKSKSRKGMAGNSSKPAGSNGVESRRGAKRPSTCNTEDDSDGEEDSSYAESPKKKSIPAKKAKARSPEQRKAGGGAELVPRGTPKVPLKPSRKLNVSCSSEDPAQSESESDDEDVIPPTPSPDKSQLRKVVTNIDPKSPAVRSKLGSKIIPGLGIDTGSPAHQRKVERVGSNLIPGLANLKRRKSIEASLVKKYLHKAPVETKGARRSPRDQKRKVSLIDMDSQTSPYLWYGRKQ